MDAHACNFQVQLHIRLAQFFAHRATFEVHFPMGMYGSTSLKPTKVFSDDGFVLDLARRLFFAAEVLHSCMRVHVCS